MTSPHVTSDSSSSTGLRPDLRLCSSSFANLRFLVLRLLHVRRPFAHGLSKSIPPFRRYIPSATCPSFWLLIMFSPNSRAFYTEHCRDHWTQKWTTFRFRPDFCLIAWPHEPT